MSKVLFWDIETLPYLSYHYGLFDVTINKDWIVNETSICNISYKWENEPVVHNLSVMDNPKRYKKDPYDDSEIVKKFLKVLKQADVVIAHNGDAFDYPILKARAIKYGYDDYHISKIDTLKLAREHKFPCGNRLKELAKFLGVARKSISSDRWWFNMATKSCIDSATKMAEYGKQDTVVLEDVFHKLLKYTHKKLPNYNNIKNKGEGNTTCPKCKGTQVKKDGKYYYAINAKQRYHCQDCRGNFIGEIVE